MNHCESGENRKKNVQYSYESYGNVEAPIK